MVTSSQSLSLGTPTDKNTDYRLWSRTATSFTPAAPDYTGQAVYGYLQNRSGDSSPGGFATAQVTHVTSPGDRLEFAGTAKDQTTWGARSISGLLYFKKEDFLGGLDAAPALRFADDAGASLNISGFAGGGTGSSRVVRLAVLNDGNWYVSYSYASDTNLFNIADLNAQKWALYPVEAGELLPTPSFSLVNYTFNGADFEQIEAIGLYFSNSHAANNGVFGAPNFHFNAFNASFEAIPEPSAALLLLPAGLLIGATAWGRRYKRS